MPNTLRGELPGLTGLRGIAALVVFVAHNRFQDLIPGISEGARWLEWHDLAVDLFFMLSGVVMAHVYAGKLSLMNWSAWRGYAVARVARIVPLYLVTLTAAMLIFCLGSMVLGKWPAYLTLSSVTTNFLLLQNWPGFFTLSVNLPSWSLSVEMFCYALGILPALWLHRHVRLRPWLAWAVIVALLLFRLKLGSETTGWQSLGRGMTGFLIGAVMPPPGRMAHLAFIVGASSFLLLRSLAVWAGWSPLWPVLAFPIVIWSLLGSGRTWLDHPAMRWLGDLSYSIYLWQGPLMLITFYQIRPRLVDFPLVLKVTWALVEVGLLLTVSAYSYGKLELPARQWVKKQFGR